MLFIGGDAFYLNIQHSLYIIYNFSKQLPAVQSSKPNETSLEIIKTARNKSKGTDSSLLNLTNRYYVVKV